MASTITQDIAQITSLIANGYPVEKVIPQMLEMFTKLNTKGNGVRHFKWTAPDAASTTGGSDQLDLNTKAQANCPVSFANLVQPDYARNIVYNGTQLTGATALTIVATGTDIKGNAVTETVSLTTAAPDVTGSVPFAVVSTIKVTAITGTGGAGDLVDIGYGVKFGLPFDYLSTADILKTVMDSDDVAKAGHTLSATYQTITFATAPNATHVYELFVKDNN